MVDYSILTPALERHAGEALGSRLHIASCTHWVKARKAMCRVYASEDGIVAGPVARRYMLQVMNNL